MLLLTAATADANRVSFPRVNQNKKKVTALPVGDPLFSFGYMYIMKYMNSSSHDLYYLNDTNNMDSLMCEQPLTYAKVAQAIAGVRRKNTVRDSFRSIY